MKIDTSDGNETQAAEYLKGVLEADGIAARLYALEPGRANLVARIRGSGAKRPILVMGHTDAVGVQRERWSVDPFAAVRRGGFLYGRGARDDKDHVTAGLMLLLLLKRLNVPLSRDVIFLAEAGEEASPRVGIDYMIARHWPEIDAEFALAEGGAAMARGGKVRYVVVSVAEKVPRGIRLVARGTAGHGSRPTADNAVVRLAEAVAKVGAWQPPMRLSASVRAYFEGLAEVSSPEQAARYSGMGDPGRAAEADRYFRAAEPAHWAMLRTTLTPTIIKAGYRGNVIPSEAEAFLDVRALPGEDLEALGEEVRRVIADAAVEVVGPRLGGRPAAPPSRTDTEMFHALSAAGRRLYAGAPTLPYLQTAATDLAQLRARGVDCYGYGPPSEGAAGGAHTDDERISEAALLEMVRYVFYTVVEAAK